MEDTRGIHLDELVPTADPVLSHSLQDMAAPLQSSSDHIGKAIFEPELEGGIDFSGIRTQTWYRR